MPQHLFILWKERIDTFLSCVLGFTSFTYNVFDCFSQATIPTDLWASSKYSKFLLIRVLKITCYFRVTELFCLVPKLQKKFGWWDWSMLYLYSYKTLAWLLSTGCPYHLHWSCFLIAFPIYAVDYWRTSSTFMNTLPTQGQEGPLSHRRGSWHLVKKRDSLFQESLDRQSLMCQKNHVLGIGPKFKSWL